MRKFLLSGLAILLAVGLMGSSFAYFSDTETSTGNTFTAGTLDMKMRKSGLDDFADDCTATWVISDMKPGDPLGVGWFEFIYKGTLTPSGFQISGTIDIDDPLPPEGPESDTQEDTPAWLMAQQVLITEAWYYDGPSNFADIDVYDLLLAADWDEDGEVTLNDLVLDALQADPVLDNLPPPGNTFGTTTHFRLRLQFSGEADNRFQGDSLYATIIFTLKQ